MSEETIGKWFWGTLMVVVSLLIALGTVSTVYSVRSNGNVDYCYVEMRSPEGMAPQYQLYAHRPWRSDRSLGIYPTLEDAKAKTDLVGCKFGGN